MGRGPEPAPSPAGFWLVNQQRCWRKMQSTRCRTLEMTEYVIREIGLHQWLVFADRQSVAFCTDENEAVKAMSEHSARNRQSRASVDNLSEQYLPA
jgi:hypothetical protein